MGARFHVKRLIGFSAIGASLLYWRVLAADNPEILDTASVAALRVETNRTDVVLTWPSDPRESFVVLWRSNATYQSPWVVLTNQLPATRSDSQTAFLDVGGLARLRGISDKTNLPSFYAVYLIPDFWFDMEGVTLSGGPTAPLEDFLPFYYGIAGSGFPRPEVGLAVDGEEAGWGPIRIERVNFGTIENPQWSFAAGFWVKLDLLGEGEHTIQLKSVLQLNNFIGTWSRNIVLTNKPVRIRVSLKRKSTGSLSWWNRTLERDFSVPQTEEEYLRRDKSLGETEVSPRPLFLNKASMRLDLGLSENFIQVTPEYSNAVVEVLLPYFSDFAARLDLPVPHPITKGDLADCRILTHRNGDEIPSTIIKTKEGLSFSFAFGNVNGFSYPKAANRHPGTAIITKEKAVQLARTTIKKTGISLEDIFADQEPRVTPRGEGTSYLVEWFDPRGVGPSVTRMEINSETGRVENFYFNGQNLTKPSPKANVVPPRGRGNFDSEIPPPVNREYASKLIPIMLKAIDDYSQKLSLPIPHPLATENVTRIEIHNNNGWPHAEIVLTNGWRFVYRHCMVNGYFAPDNLFNSDDRKIHIREFEGKWKLTTNQAISAIKSAMTKLDYPTNQVHMDFAPTVQTAAVNKEHVPRLRFEWLFSVQDDLQSRLEAEVNTDSGKLESLYYDDKAYWECRPQIDVPISSR